MPRLRPAFNQDIAPTNGRGGAKFRFKQFVMALLLLQVSCSRPNSEVIVFHATNVAQLLGDAAEAFQKEHPSIRIRLEPSGTQVAVRKVAELGMRADVLMLVDTDLVQRLLVPQHVSYVLTVATGEIVIAHKDHSQFTDELSSNNWTEVLLRPRVRLGRTHADTASIGYHTLVVWELAAQQHSIDAPDLAHRLRSKIEPSHVVADEPELLGLLESAAIDYAFLYRSTAEDHRLKITTLPPTQNLSSLELASAYAAAKLDVPMRLGGEAIPIRGAPITYGLAIVARAPHPVEAAQWVAFLLSEGGRRIFQRRGFAPVVPARCNPCAGVPAELAPLVSSAR